MKIDECQMAVNLRTQPTIKPATHETTLTADIIGLCKFITRTKSSVLESELDDHSYRSVDINKFGCTEVC